MNESFLATIAFAILALFCLFLTSLAAWVFGGHGAAAASAIVLTLLAMALAYVAQMFYTRDMEHLGVALQTAAAVAAGLAGIFLMAAL